jgi:ribosomal silencing factor RsfS
LKRRKLTGAPGITGAEGYDCDDWMIVDCWNLIVHVMEANYRKVLNNLTADVSII